MKQWLRIEIMALSLCVGSIAFMGCKGGSGEPTSAGKPGATAAGSSEVLARIGDTNITVAEFEMHISRNPAMRARITTPDQKRKLLDGLVEREALAQEAKRLGYEKEPEVQLALRSILASYMVKTEFNNKRAKEVTVSDQDIEKYYQANYVGRFKTGERIRVQQVLFSAPKNNPVLRKKSKVFALEALKQLRANPQEEKWFKKITQGSEAAKIGKPSVETTPPSDKAWLEHKYGKAFVDAAWNLKNANDLSDLIEDDNGYYFLRFIERQPESEIPLDDVKEQIRNVILSQARMDAYPVFVEEIKRKVGVQIFEKELDKIQIDASKPAPQNQPVPGAPPPPPAPSINTQPEPPAKDKPVTGDKPTP
jgi:hypothetical protein